ncbi:hypothetical protein [Halotia branconii]|uniref:Uncharacterized protein n=1 Tax=Halotia branconii CENA392 TaxID=1539056 RepID=A0AAJ6NZ33_9CYAN|nr:hypothetical protein [Halotia branconii]WGV29139.1 hypothetical protein QI031_30515 [Halotia branconii CENA392]
MNLKIVTFASLLLVANLSAANAQKTRIAYEMTATSCNQKMLDEVRKNSAPDNNRLASEVIKSVPQHSTIRLNSNERYICGYTWVSIVTGEKVARIDKTQSRNAYRAFRVITIPIKNQN